MSGLELLPLGSPYVLSALGVGAGGAAYVYSTKATEEVNDEHVLDPRTDAYWESFHKACVHALTSVGTRNVVSSIPSFSSYHGTLFHYDVELSPGVRGLVALTIDDAPCRQRAQDRNMAKEVKALLRAKGALATFFLCADHASGHEAAMVDLLADGHELANHCARDRIYAADSEEDFQREFLRSEEICNRLRRLARGQAAAEARARRRLVATLPCVPASCCCPLAPPRPLAQRSRGVATAGAEQAPKWFRAPGGALSVQMQRVLNRHGFLHVLCDAYANDPWISDPLFIADSVLSHTSDGSIIVVHMPERGFREYTFEAIRLLLDGLAQRGLRSVTLSELQRAACPPGAHDAR